MEVGAKIHAPNAIVVIGASTGGPISLAQILPKFPKDFRAAVVVVQHMRPGFTKLLARQLSGVSELIIDELEYAQPLVRSAAYVAPGDCSFIFSKAQNTSIDSYTINIESNAGSAEFLRRRVDNTMASAAKVFGSKTVGVLLTGLSDDGRRGMKEIHDAGGITIAQDEVSSVVFDMPRAAIEAGVVNEVLPLWSIAERIVEIVGGL